MGIDVVRMTGRDVGRDLAHRGEQFIEFLALHHESPVFLDQKL
ncbi:hypothetical protein [Sphingomonas panacisoli]|nr:hypothetical protein [Sphingomonas panacisoli]